ncbi:MAG: choice-of-anchor D domain-containing protein [Fidelibacterota bacterium]
MRRFFLILHGVLLLVWGCSDLGEEPEEVPRIAVASTVHFGAVAVGDTSDTTLTVANTGTANLVITGLSLEGRDTSDFLIIVPEDNELDPGTEWVVDLFFMPQSEGTRSATLHIMSNDPGTPDAEVSLQGVGGEPMATVSFSQDVQPIFTTNCALTGCHVSDHETGLDLREGQSYALLVNVTSAGYAPTLRVKPFDPEDSVLWHKVAGTGGQWGDRMPLGEGPLAEQDTTSIRTWIEEGAQEN